MILIKNGKIITMANEIMEDGCVLIEGTKIKQVAKKIDVEEKGIQVIDANGGYVMPGIIEAHCHIGITEEKTGETGDDGNEIYNPIVPYLKGIDGINPMDSAFHDAIRAGITGVNVGPGSANIVGGQFVFLKTSGRKIDDMIVKEPSAMKVSFGENPKATYAQQQKSPVTRMAVAGLLREELTKAKQYLRKKQEAQKSGEIFDMDYRYECWEKVFQKKIPLKAHVHRADDILTAIRIAKEFDLYVTLDHCSEGHIIANYIKESGYPAIVGPSLAARSKVECRNASFKTAGILQKAGVLVALTTDHPVSLIQYLPVCAGFAAKEGLGILEGLKAITINAAKICGVEDRLGSLEEGKDADIAIFDDNPMKTFTHTLYTIIDGEIVYDYKKEYVV